MDKERPHVRRHKLCSRPTTTSENSLVNAKVNPQEFPRQRNKRQECWRLDVVGLVMMIMMIFRGIQLLIALQGHTLWNEGHDRSLNVLYLLTTKLVNNFKVTLLAKFIRRINKQQSCQLWTGFYFNYLR